MIRIEPAPSIWPAALACGLLVSLMLLRLLPGSVTALLPACPLFQFTGLLCPGCGSTRALLALTYGDMETAWRLNPLFVVLLPLFGLYLACALRRHRFPPLPHAVTGSILAVAVLFALVRNLRG